MIKHGLKKKFGFHKTSLVLIAVFANVISLDIPIAAHELDVEKIKKIRQLSQQPVFETKTLLGAYIRVFELAIDDTRRSKDQTEFLKAELSNLKKQLANMPSEVRNLNYSVMIRHDKKLLNNKELVEKHKSGELTRQEFVEEYLRAWRDKQGKLSGPRNLAEQKSAINKSLTRVENVLGSNNSILSSFVLFLSQRHGINYLLDQEWLLEPLRIDDKNKTQIKNKNKASSKKLSASLIEAKRDAIKLVLNELTNEQRKLLARRMGLKMESICELYDLADSRSITNVLNAKKASAGYSGVGRMTEPVAKSINELDSSGDDLPAYWNPRLTNLGMRFHAAEVTDPSTEPWLLMKRLYKRGPDGPRNIPVLNTLICSERSIANVLKKVFPNSGAPVLTREQWKKIKEISKTHDRETSSATTIQEFVDANNRWLESVGQVLVPEQAGAIYQQFVGYSGIVIFLTRPDTCSDFKISNTRRNRILKAGKDQAGKMSANVERLKRDAILASLREFSKETQSKLSLVFGEKLDELAAKFAKIQTDDETIFFLGNEPAESVYQDKKFNEFIFVN